MPQGRHLGIRLECVPNSYWGLVLWLNTRQGHEWLKGRYHTLASLFEGSKTILKDESSFLELTPRASTTHSPQLRSRREGLENQCVNKTHETLSINFHLRVLINSSDFVNSSHIRTSPVNRKADMRRHFREPASVYLHLIKRLCAQTPSLLFHNLIQKNEKESYVPAFKSLISAVPSFHDEMKMGN